MASKSASGNVFTFEHWGGAARIAEGSSPQDLVFYDSANGIPPAHVEKISKNQDQCRALSTEESEDLIHSVSAKGVRVQVLPRAVAVYWSFKDRVENHACVVLSIGLESAVGSLVKEGELHGEPVQCQELSLKSLCRRNVTANAQLCRLTEAYKRKDPDFEQKLSEAFATVLSTGRQITMGPIPLRPPINFSSSLDVLKDFLVSVDPNGEARVVVLSDWAATHCNLADLLSGIGKTVLRPEPEKAFTQALTGLAFYGFSVSGAQAVEPPVLRLKEEKLTFSDVEVGASLRETLRIRNVGGGTLEAVTKAGVPWVKIVPEKISCKKDEEKAVQIKVDTRNFLPGRDYGTELEIKWSTGTRTNTNKVLISVSTAIPAFLCCAAPTCPQFLVKGRSIKFCPECGTELQPISLDHWTEKAVKPLLDSNLLAVLNSTETLFQPMIEAGVPKEELETRLDGCFEARAGVSREIVKHWLKSDVRSLLEPGANVESARQAVLGRAEEMGLSPSLAQILLRQIVPILEVPAEPLRFHLAGKEKIFNHSVLVRNAGGGSLTGDVSTSLRILSVNPTHFEGVEREKRIALTININKSTIAPGSRRSGEILVETTGGSETIPVTIERAESGFRTLWMLAFGVVFALTTAVILWWMFLKESPKPLITVKIGPEGDLTVQQGDGVDLFADFKPHSDGKYTYQWDAAAGGRIEGDGSTVKLDTSNVKLTGPERQQIKVSLTIKDMQGATGSAHKTVTVVPPPPVEGGKGPIAVDSTPTPKPLPTPPTVDLTASPLNVLAGQIVILTAKAKGESLRFTWWTSIGDDWWGSERKFEEGVTRLLTTPKDYKGEITVKITVRDRYGRTAQDPEIITVGPPPPDGTPPREPTNRPPTIDGWPVRTEEIQLGETAQFTVRAFDPEGHSLQYNWLTSHGRLEASGPQASLSTKGIPISGEFIVVTVTVIVRCDQGLSANGKQTVKVRKPPPPPPPLGFSAWMEGPKLNVAVQFESGSATSGAGSIQVEVELQEGRLEFTLATGSLPGVPCTIDFEQTENVREQLWVEKPEARNKWLRTRVSLQPINPQRPIRLNLSWRILPQREEGRKK